METIEQVQGQVIETGRLVIESERSATSTLLELGDSLLDLRLVIANAVAEEQEFARTGGVKDGKTAERNLRQLLWQMRMLANAANTARQVAAGIAEDYAAKRNGTSV